MPVDQTPLPNALIVTRNVLEAQDLADMLRSLFGLRPAIYRSLAEAVSAGRPQVPAWDLAFLTGPEPGGTDEELLETLWPTCARIVMIDLEPEAAQALGAGSLLRPFGAPEVQAALGRMAVL